MYRGPLDEEADDFERLQKTFRGGTHDRDWQGLRRDELVDLLADIFDVLVYKNISIQIQPHSIDAVYTENKKFWQDALSRQHFQSRRLLLKGFHLTEWMPSSPGRYFTSRAEEERRNAAEYDYDSQLKEYRPAGKGRMVLGGIGSIRLGANEIGANKVFFLGASSTGISHQGIPIVLHEAEYHHALQVISKYGGCFVNLTGILQILPTNMRILHYDAQIPRYCFVADQIELIRPSSIEELLITISITFPHNISISRFEKSWSFCSFSPNAANNNLETAVEWLKAYANRYSEITNPLILSNFDEHYVHFDNPVEFPLADILNDKTNIARLNEYRTYYDFDLNTNNLLGNDTGKSWQLLKLNKRPNYKCVNIFFCYAHEDEPLINELKKQLIPLQRQGYVNIWHDRDIKPGMIWEHEIDKHLNTADVILLMVSPDFMNSDYCYTVEMKRAIERRERGEAVVIPVILRPVHWEDSPFGSLQALPTDARPVTDPSWYNRDSALFDVAEGVRRVAEQLAVSPFVGSQVTPIKASDIKLSTLRPEEFVLLRTITIPNCFFTSITISPDGQLFACKDRDGTIKLGSCQTGQLLQTFKVRSGYGQGIAVSPDGQVIAIGRDGSIELWSCHTGQQIKNLRGHKGIIISLTINPDGNTLISTGADETIRFWDLSTGKHLRTLKLSSKTRSSPRFSSNERLLAYADLDGTIKLLSLPSGQLLLTLSGHRERVSTLIISADGEILASAGDDGKIKLWSLPSGQLLSSLSVDSRWVSFLAISPEDQVLLSAEHGERSKVKVNFWTLATGQLLGTLTIQTSLHWKVYFCLNKQIFICGGDQYVGEIAIWGKINDK